MLKLGDRTSLRCVRKRTEASNTAERIVPGARHSTWTRNTGLEGLWMSNAEVSASLHKS